jgi:hypothetical protein
MVPPKQLQRANNFGHIIGVIVGLLAVLIALLLRYR